MNTTTTFRELAHRRNDGIDVTMFWDSATDRVTVSVAGGRSLVVTRRLAANQLGRPA